MSPPARMRAVVFEAPDRFAVADVPMPEPAAGHALVRVEASMVCATDRKILAGKFAGTKFPHVPGHEFAGTIAALGPGTSGPAPGTRVGVEVHVGCGVCDRCREGLYNLCRNYGRTETGHAHVGFTIAGGLAEYASVPVAALHPLPDAVSTADGAWTDNLGVALWALERARLLAGESVVVIGSGAIGICAAQLARASGAGRVTLVGRGERLARAGRYADAIIDERDAGVLAGTADVVVEFAGTSRGCRASRSRRPAAAAGSSSAGRPARGSSSRRSTSRRSSVATSTFSAPWPTRRASRAGPWRSSRRARSTWPASRRTTSRSTNSATRGRRSPSAGTARSA